MRLKTGLLLLFLSTVSTPALAAPEPTRAETWDWVKKLPVPAADPARRTAPVQSLLVTAQTLHGAQSDDHYVEYALLIQEPQGLAAGALAIPWHPDLSDLVVHKVHILRDGKTIDVLAAGQEFMVLRRENNLERAMLDGILTAVLQPEGLAVGDTVNVAFTIRRKPDRNGFRSENIQLLAPGIATERMYLRDVWPTERKLRWRASELMPKPKFEKTKLGNELILDAADAAAPAAPQDAPARFRVPQSLEISEYASWNELSSIVAPLYAEATELRADSPLSVEINRIGASTADPGKRAMAALRLVQDKIRYVALAMGDGGVVPASADQTWSRKYGDCKGKTVTLLALLKGLGIEAEPMLVSSAFGDSLAERLPMARIFDHVLVRARIGGKDYYLDGTRSGDRLLEELASTPFGSGLPLRTVGASLEKLPLLPPALPLTEAEVRYDASQGFHQAAPVSGRVTLRGDTALIWRLALAQAGEAEIKGPLEDLVPVLANDDFEITTIDADEETNSFSFSFSGKTRMGWYDAPSSRALRFQFSDTPVNWEPEFKREAGPFSQAPFELDFPVFNVVREVVILPGGGGGFTLEAPTIQEIVAGTLISRKVTLEGGTAVALSTFRRLQREIGVAEGVAAAAKLKSLGQREAYVRSPDGYRASKAEIASILKSEPKTAEEYVERGYRLMDEGKNKSAQSDFERAIELAPDWSIAHSNRAIALIHRDDLAEAEKSLVKAASLSDEDFVVHQGYGLLHSKRDEPEKAVEAFTRSLSLKADNVFNLHQRAAAYMQLGRLEEALADLARVAELEPKSVHSFLNVARLNAALGRADAALAAADRAVTVAPEQTFAARYRADLLERFGRGAEAKQGYAQALRLADREIAASKDDSTFLVMNKIILLSSSREHRAAIDLATARLKQRPDSIQFLTARCRARAVAEVELNEALKDCNLALKLEPENSMATEARALLKLRMGRWDEAIADYDDLLRWLQNSPGAYFGRGIARLRKGDKAGGDKDLALAKRYGFDTDAEFALMGIRP
jgi:tetratricopeptide (TPR) repeat protein